jgi:hypothetical protein
MKYTGLDERLLLGRKVLPAATVAGMNEVYSVGRSLNLDEEISIYCSVIVFQDIANHSIYHVEYMRSYTPPPSIPDTCPNSVLTFLGLDTKVDVTIAQAGALEPTLMAVGGGWHRWGMGAVCDVELM